MIALTFFLSSPLLAIAGAVDLPKTGQMTCYDSSGNPAPCATTGQDGDFRAGVAWPNPRFTVSGDCVTDNFTGLMWVKKPDSITRRWQQAIDFASGLSLCGYTDWRLPNINELESLVNAGTANTAAWLNSQGFSNVQSDYYWSSTTDTVYALFVYMWDGSMYDFTKSAYVYAWPVRAGQDISPQNTWKTGQTISYAAGDDGDLERGVAWPSPRYTVSGDCVTDNLTGLMWTGDANLPGMYKTWQQALDYANGLSLCGYTDWRLPNRKELRSQIDYSKTNPALPLDHPFTNVESSDYWSSTTNASITGNAWFVNLWSGYMYHSDKFHYYNYVWPVRAGQLGSLDNLMLSVAKSGTGDGTVTSAPAGIVCGSDCEEVYTEGTGVTFTAIPALDSVFVGWEGDADCQDGVVTMDVNTTCTATFSTICSLPPEVCNGVDDNCNGQIDEGVKNTYYQDSDMDTYGNGSVTTQACTQPSGYVINNTDCNDNNASIHPGALEVCNGLDDNCNTQVDEGYNQDGDGYTTCAGDCNDNNASVYPGAPEVCNNGMDDNCNGQIDDAVQNTYYQDADNDTYGNAAVAAQACIQPSGYVSDNTDCDDSDLSINPGAIDIPNDGIDQDCSGADSGATSKLGNISTRGTVQTGDSVMIGGFIISGTAPRSVLVRGFGPTLADFGVSGAMSNPYIELYSGQTMIATNDNWQTPIAQCDAPAVSCGTPQDIQATGKDACTVASTGCAQDAAIIVTLPPGAYTAIMRGVGGGTGVGLIGVDDNDTSTSSKLVNISTRGLVLTGDSVMIGGFIVSGNASKTVLIRGFGPTLADFGVSGAMSNPYVELYSGQTRIATNDSWQIPISQCDAPAVSCGTPQDIQATGKSACSVASTGCTRDAAILVTIPPGAYTAIVRGVSGGTGVGLVGIDEIVP